MCVDNYRFFFGFQYADGVYTTCGDPNQGNERWKGCYSTAGEIFAFVSKSDRDDWVDEGHESIGGRVACTRAKANWFMRGAESRLRKEAFERIEREALEKEILY